MKLIKKTKGSHNTNEVVLTLQPQHKEDLFTLYNIINTDDEIIISRKVTSKITETEKNKITNLVKLRLKIISSEFEPQHEFLRYKGITTEDDTGIANKDIPIGKYFSITIGFSFPLLLFKYDFNSYVSKLLNDACNPENKSEMAAIALQEGIAHICILTNSSTILKHKIEYSIPKKKRDTDILKFDEKTEKFYRATYESMVKHFDFDNLKVIILCSPGFYANTLYTKIIQYAQKDQNKSIITNKHKLLIAHSSTGYLQGITEVLKNSNYSSSLKDTKNSQEICIMDEFLKHLNNDDYKAWYGEEEILKASKLSAIDTLLITDSWLRSNDIQIRNRSIELVERVENFGGKTCIFSSLHPSGEELNKLTGLACILKYSIPNLDELNSEEI